jgi:hypothetical protein
MKKIGPKLLACLGLIGVMAVTQVWAQPGAGMGGGRGRGWGVQDTYGRMFDPKTVEKVTGEVASVETFAPGKGMSSGTHITFKTDGQTIPVHLGPNWFMQEQGLTLAAQDKVIITGSRITYQGKPAIIASEVAKDNRVWKLRDATGMPQWAGQGRR